MPTRRTLLTTTAATLTAATAGCISDLKDIAGVQRSVDEIKNDSQTLNYTQLYRQNSEYVGTAVHFPELHLFDYLNIESSPKKYLFNMPSGTYADNNTICGTWTGNPFNEGDTVEAWGVLDGLETYQSLTGKLSVPRIDIREMQLR